MIATCLGGGDELSLSAGTGLQSELVVMTAVGSAQRADTAAPFTPSKIRDGGES